MKIAIIGSGISGLAAAHRLRTEAQVTLFESADYFGGHTNTVDVTLPGHDGHAVTHGVDTGFLVLNERTYPGLIALLQELDVPVARSDMSFSVQVPGAGSMGRGALEWNGANLASVFSQPSNLLRPRFLGMLQEVLRFNKLCSSIAENNEESALTQSLGDFLQQHAFADAFRDWYFLPMLGSIWSCPTDQMLRFPVATMIRFCHNHGLIQVKDRPQWWTVSGGARQYVKKIVNGLRDARLRTPVHHIERNALGVHIHTQGYAERFDAAVLAVHSDQALRILAKPSLQERAVLGAIRYHPNLAVLHTDAGVMPKRRAAWAAWNYERASTASHESHQVCLHYWLNRLQPLPFAKPVLVSLNPTGSIDSSRVLAEFDYAHPVFDLSAIKAQTELSQLQGAQNTWFCGAWTGFGFHEDGLQSGYAVAESLLAQMHGALAA